MLKWFAGSVPGKALKRQQERTPEEVAASKKTYEVKRARGFKTHWTEGRPWLSYDENKNLMFCQFCMSAGKSNKFTSGTDNFRIDSIQAHENSSFHKEAVSTAERPAVRQSEAGKALHQLKKHEYNRMDILFRNAHAIAKKHQSFRSYNWLCQLDKAKGLDIGETYLNDKKAKEFVENIASVARTDVSLILDTAKFVSVTCDGSSDFMGDEYESLYVRSALNGKVTEKFLCLGVAESAASVDIYNFIKEQLSPSDSSKPWYNKLVGFCSDGASNMQG